MNLKSKLIASVVAASVGVGSMYGASVIDAVKINEGFSQTAYLDGAGIPTVCYGETHAVKLGQKRSVSDCQQQLVQSLGVHAEVLVGLPDDLPDVVALGAVDMGYNAGTIGTKTKKYLQQHNYADASKAVLEFRYITITKNGKRVKYDCSTKGNKRCYGMWLRRQWEAKAIGNQFSTTTEAINALKLIYGVKNV